MDPSDDSRNERQQRRGTCPRCGGNVEIKPRGRSAVWCSQDCRRAAYEERRAAARGAIALEIIDRVEVEVHEHPLGTCVDRAIASPAGCRRVLHELARLAHAGELQSDPKWRATYTTTFTLVDALRSPERRL